MKSTLRIYAFRHGQTDWNKEGRIQGHRDVPLNEQGRADAIRLALAFRRLQVGMILTSDLSRARDTARIALAEACRAGWHSEVPIIDDPRLREVDLGALQGLTHAEIHEKFGKALSSKLGSEILTDEELRDLGSERAEDLYARVLSSIHDASASEALREGNALALSTHGGVLRRLLHSAGGISNIGFSIPNAMFFPFEYDLLERKLLFVRETRFPSEP